MQRFSELAPGVLVATSELLTCNTTAVTGRDGGCLLIDPAVTVADLSGLAGELAAAGLRPQAGFATHPHWDHVLWCRELGDVPRYAAAKAAATAQGERSGLIEGMQDTAPGHDLSLFGRLTALPQDASRLPWDGPEAQLIVHEAHAPGHCAVFLPDAGVLVAGDMLSDIEIPILDTAQDDLLGDYLAGLDQLAALDGVRWLVPGHGRTGDAAEFRRRIAADRRYLDLLAIGQPFDDPRCTAQWLRDWHEQQLRRVAGPGTGSGKS